MAWIYLLIAGTTEIVWAIGLKEANGFTVFIPSIVTLIFIVVSFFSFRKRWKQFAVGTGYAVWAGIGAAGSVLISMIFFHEKRSALKFLFLSFTITGVTGLKLFG